MTRRKDPRTTRLPVPAGVLPAFTPVPRRCNRHDGWTPQRQRDFIEALADTGSVDAACKAVNMSTVGAYHLRRQSGGEAFRAAWERALQLGVQRVEDVVMDRALNGVEEPLYSYGKLIGTRRKYNDRLLMFILRNRAPDRFADGRPKALNAIDLMELERHKKQWRKEWEAEHTVFRDVEAEMKGIEWGRLYETYRSTAYDPAKVSEHLRRLYGDPYVKNRRGVFEFILGGLVDTKLLEIRVFDKATSQAAYAKQTAKAKADGVSNCPLCAVGNSANKTKIWEFREMDADHVTAWSKGGKTTAANCEMLCVTHNRAKGNR
jgi:hypothetical protein